MLPLYDNGKGTNYDMRHYIKSIAPNRARWDYHVVHVHQLNLFKSIFKEEIYFQNLLHVGTDILMATTLITIEIKTS